MSTPINGVQPKEWAKHLRPDGKRQFWKRHRQASIVEEKAIGKRNPAKVKKKYGYEWRYRPGAKLSWFHTISLDKRDPYEWKPYRNWYATGKARDAAYKSLISSYYGLEPIMEFRSYER